MVLGKLPIPGRPTVWKIVEQGSVALAVVAGGGFGAFLLSSIFLFSFSLSLGDGPIQTEILSQRAIKPNTTNNQAIIKTSTV